MLQLMLILAAMPCVIDPAKVADDWRCNMELRIHSGDSEPDRTDLTLRQVFENYWLPERQNLVADSTAQDYRNVIGKWEAFIAERASCTTTGAPESSQTGYPVDSICQIQRPQLDEFGRWLMEENATKKLSQSTTDKYADKISSILHSVGPRSHKWPQSPQLIEFVPVMSPAHRIAKTREKTRKGVPLANDQLGSVYKACAVADWPTSFAVLQWRTYLVLMTLLGPRAEDGATVTPDCFHFDPEIPIAGRRLSHPYGWIDFTAEKTQKDHLVPLPLVVNQHVRKLLERRDGLLFSWKSRRQRPFIRNWKKITSQAGLPDVQRKDLRATCKNIWDRAGDGVELGKWVLGHAAKGVSDQHYTDRIPDLIAAAARLDVPTKFQKTLRSGASERFLF